MSPSVIATSPEEPDFSATEILDFLPAVLAR